MKKTVFILLAAAMAICGAAQTTAAEETDVKREGLKGRVKNVKEVIYEAVTKFGEVTKGTATNSETTQYNYKGYQTERIYANYNTPPAGTEYRYTYKYDSRGNKIEECRYDLKSGDIYDKEAWTFNEENKITKKYSYEYSSWSDTPNVPIRTKTSVCKRNGNTVEYSHYDEKNVFTGKTIFKTDDNGNVLKRTWYDANGDRISWEMVVVYDRRGNVIEESGWYEPGDPRNRDVAKLVYDYDEKGNKIETRSYHYDGSLSHKTTYQYNDKGDETESFYHSSNGEVSIETTVRYKYDHKGNWVERISYSGEAKTPATFTDRKIEYYE
jgi:hypothetical protein